MKIPLGFTLMLALLGLGLGCATTTEQTAAGPRCPVCAHAGPSDELCLTCRAVFTAEPAVTCPECGMVKSGTWCRQRQAFHFSDNGSKCCGKRRGQWDNEWRCGKFVGLEKIVFCETCEKPYPRDGACPTCK